MLPCRDLERKQSVEEPDAWAGPLAYPLNTNTPATFTNSDSAAMEKPLTVNQGY